MYSFLSKTFHYFSKVSPVIILAPRAESYGNCAEELYFGLLKAKRENKKLLFLCPQNLFFRRLAANQKLCHFHSVYSIQNKVICNLGGWLLTCLFVLKLILRTLSRSKRLGRIFRLIWPKNLPRMAFDFYHMTPIIGRSTLWRPDGVNFFSWEIVREQNWKQQYAEYDPPKLMGGDHRRAEQLRIQMGIPLADWFVCFHVRESGYRKDADIFRNASIENSIEGIKAITAAGGWVVRIGDPSMTPLPQLERVIDYPHTRYNSELMDIYLISQCSLFIGPNSGPSDVATLFGKPMIIVNSTEWTLKCPLKKGDLTIIKHIFSRSRNRFLSIEEILEGPFDWQGFSSHSSEYMMVENTPEEIRDVIEEYLAEPEDYDYSELQEAFNQGRCDQIHRYLDPIDERSVVTQYRIASRADAAAGTLGQKYLEQNWIADNLEKSSFRPLVGHYAGQQ